MPILSTLVVIIVIIAIYYDTSQVAVEAVIPEI